MTSNVYGKRKNDQPVLHPLRWLGRLLVYMIWMPFTWMLKTSWQIIRAMGRWVWRATGRVLRMLWAGFVWTVKLPWQLLRWLFVGHVPEFENNIQAEAYRLTRQRFRRRRRLQLHIGAYAFTWVAFLLNQLGFFGGYTNPATANQTLGLLLVWLVVVLLHWGRIRLGDAENNALLAVLADHRTPEKTKRSYEEEQLIYGDERSRQRLSDQHLADEAAYPWDDGELPDDVARILHNR